MVIDIRTRGFTLTPGLRTHVERRLEFALDRYQDRVARARVVLGDVNGPRGGRDKRCKLELTLRGSSPVRATAISRDLYAAVDQAAHRAGQSLTRALTRERTTTLELLWLARALDRNPDAA